MNRTRFVVNMLVLLLVLEFVLGKGREKIPDKLRAGQEPGRSVENRTRNTVAQHVKSKKVSCTRDNINEMAKTVRCKPRLTVVELLSGTKNRFVPNAVLAKRCSGSCDGFQRCLPTRSVNSTFFVKEFVKEKTYCSAIPITEDTDCNCDCSIKPKDCSPYQQYSPTTCSCKCVNEENFRKCWSSTNKNMKWNERKCSCECIGSKTCLAGMFWEASKCRCMKQ